MNFNQLFHILYSLHFTVNERCKWDLGLETETFAFQSETRPRCQEADTEKFIETLALRVTLNNLYYFSLMEMFYTALAVCFQGDHHQKCFQLFSRFQNTGSTRLSVLGVLRPRCRRCHCRHPQASWQAVRRRPYPNASSRGLRGRARTVCHRAVQQVTGVFPTQFKAAFITPLLKKSDLDPSQGKSYRHVQMFSGHRSLSCNVAHIIAQTRRSADDTDRRVMKMAYGMSTGTV